MKPEIIVKWVEETPPQTIDNYILIAQIDNNAIYLDMNRELKFPVMVSDTALDILLIEEKKTGKTTEEQVEEAVWRYIESLD